MPRPHQQQCRSNVRLCCQKRQQCRTSFALKLRTFDKVERCFDNVAVLGNKVACCFDNVASTLLLVWTGLKIYPQLHPSRQTLFHLHLYLSIPPHTSPPLNCLQTRPSPHYSFGQWDHSLSACITTCVSPLMQNIQVKILRAGWADCMNNAKCQSAIVAAHNRCSTQSMSYRKADRPSTSS